PGASPPQSGKAKDYCQACAGRLPCSAALGSLARACPAESALSRVGSLFRSKRKKFRVSSEAPTYTALYLGNATTLQAKGEGCTDVAVGKIWAKSEAGRHGTKMKLTTGPEGTRRAPAVAAEAACRPGHLYLLHRVTYCVADPRLPRLFAWIYRHEVKHKAVLLRCHAVLVSKAEKARAMALLLYQTSAAALAEFRRLKKRADARHQQLQQVGPGADGAIPLVPLRKLLLPGPGGCYKPPVERSRSAPKLGSITEDSLGPGCANGGQDEARDGEDEDEEDELLAPLDEGDGDGAAPAGPSPAALTCGLGELAIGNDVALLGADLRAPRLLGGESTGSESSIESNGQEGASPSPALSHLQGQAAPGAQGLLFSRLHSQSCLGPCRLLAWAPRLPQTSKSRGALRAAGPEGAVPRGLQRGLGAAARLQAHCRTWLMGVGILFLDVAH
ncbi:protein FAM43A, partial [Python bivittatus]|uniref:Protein FAM43A n=1 Tax=Python bivittatus TaxID=176946 RepID=A0A9F5MZK0_PYTBI